MQEVTAQKHHLTEFMYEIPGLDKTKLVYMELAYQYTS